MDCLFCKIARHQVPAKLAFEDDEMLAFHDIVPQAPLHILLIPKQHIATVNNASEEDGALLGRLILKARQLAMTQFGEDAGYRLVMNVNPQGGQAVYHIHLHLLAGRQMNWPPG